MSPPALLDFSASFDTANALSGMFLWLLFGQLSRLLNCDLQRVLASSPAAQHATALVAFFFLFTLIDAANNASLLTTWVKTLVVYGLFLLTTKSKWYFAVPVLALLLVDQSIKKHATYKRARGELTPADEARYTRAGRALNVATAAVAIVGTLHYAMLQRTEYGPRFSATKLLFGVTRCKRQAPDYMALARRNLE